MPTPKFYGRVLRNTIKFDLPDKWKVYLSGLEGKQVEVTVRKERTGRTLSQNAYYWGVVVEILGEHFGYDSEGMHFALKLKFLKTHEDTDLVTVQSTAKLSISEMCDYIDRIMRWAAEEGVYIPEAGEVVL